MENVERVREAQGGSREAFSILVGDYHAFVYRLCYRMLGNAADAEDTTQETFVEAYLKLAQLRDPERFGGWLRVLALNLCRMRWRGTGQPMAELPEEVAAPAPAEADRAGARVTYGLSQLSPQHRIALVLHYLEGLSYEEVAQFLGVPIGTVMSRLHRGRRALKEMLAKMREDEEVPMIPDEECRREVDAEIRVLLGIFREEPVAAERLSVLLSRSPERLVQWVRESTDGAIVDDVALLLPRLGSAAVDALIACYASVDAATRERASAILSRSVAHCRHGWPGTGESSRRLAPRHAYVVAERVIGSSLSGGARARLFLGMMDAAEGEPTALLFTHLLLCEGRNAFELLMGRFQAPEPQVPQRVIYALCRTGASFCTALAELLRGGDAHLKAAALAGVEAVGRSLDPHELRCASPAHFAYEVRTRLKWPPIRSSDVGQGVLDDLAEATSGLLEHPETVLRDAAIRALGALGHRASIQRLRACLRNPEVSTRLAAVVALAELGDEGSAPELMEMARGGSAAERRTATEALGRLGVAGAQSLMVDLLGDPDAQVRRSAVTSLGEIGGEETRAALQGLLHGADRALAKAAVGALHGGRRPGPTGLSPTLRQRLLGGETAEQPFTLDSIEAALLFALPAVQAYEERDLTRRIAGVCSNYSGTRRYLIDEGLMNREGGIYTFTPLGETLWRVEHHIQSGASGE